jgi:hypothetical protein
MPNMLSRPPLSLADVDRTKSNIPEQLSKLEEPGIDFVAFELGRTIRVSMEQGLARITKLRLRPTNGGCPRTVDNFSNLPLARAIELWFQTRVERPCKKPGRRCGSGHRRKGRVDLPEEGTMFGGGWPSSHK